MATVGQVILCRAAVAWEPGKPWSVETISVDPPKSHEVRIKICYAAVCHTDLFFGDGCMGTQIFPCILGHEAVGIVESVGDGVFSLSPGDHVIPLPMPQCGTCECCLHPDANTCVKIQDSMDKGLMPDGTTRFKCKGKEIKHFMCCSAFSEYTVCADIAVAKISPKAPMENICIMGCGFPTGYGAARRTCKIEPGSSVAVWGLGAVGLSAIAGAKAAGAEPIVAIDNKDHKAELAHKFGATDFINRDKMGDSLIENLLEKSGGGFQYTIECVGHPAPVREAIETTRKGFGVCCIAGCCEKDANFIPQQLIYGRTIKGSLIGGWKTREEFPKLVDEYLAGKIPVEMEDYVTDRFEFDEIDKAVEILRSQEKVRSVITIGA